MADLEAGLYAQLSADATLVALVSDRIFPDELPEDVEYPALVFQVVSTAPDYTHDGDSNWSTDRVQFDAWSEGNRRSDAAAVMAAVRNAISGKRFTAAGVRVQGCFLAGARPAALEKALNKWRISRDYLVEWKG